MSPEESAAAPVRPRRSLIGRALRAVFVPLLLVFMALARALGGVPKIPSPQRRNQPTLVSKRRS